MRNYVKKPKFFRGKYAIAMYTEDEEFVDIQDSVWAYGEKYGKAIMQKIRDSLSKGYTLTINEKKVKPFVISLNDEDDFKVEVVIDL